MVIGDDSNSPMDLYTSTGFLLTRMRVEDDCPVFMDEDELRRGITLKRVHHKFFEKCEMIWNGDYWTVDGIMISAGIAMMDPKSATTSCVIFNGTATAMF